MRRLLVVGLVSALTLGACGNDSTDGGAAGGDTINSVDFLAASASKTIEAGSAKVDMVIELDQGSMTATGAFEFATGRGTMTMDLGPMLAASGAPEGADTTAEIVLDGTNLYMKMGLLSAFAPPGSSGWFKIDLEEAGAQAGLDLSSFTQGNPGQYLQMLAGVEGVTEVGSEKVRGVSTTHYRATVNLRKAMESSGMIIDAETLENLIEQFGTEIQEIEVWIDDDGLVRRTRSSIPGPTGGTVTVELYDYGHKVEIKVPADATDLADMMGGAGADAG